LATERLLRRQIQSEEHEPSGRLVESSESYVPSAAARPRRRGDG
jgi:hypothetical protein